jgi:hypothetical protein
MNASNVELSTPKLLHIWTEIAKGRNYHGDFLKSFAAAYIRADDQNLQLIHSAALALVVKYQLTKYLDNFDPMGSNPAITR